MRSTNNFEDKRVKTDEKEKRSIMYSQIFNYNLLSRDPMMRAADVSAAVEAGGKEISDKKSRFLAIWILGGIATFIMIVKFIADFFYNINFGK